MANGDAVGLVDGGFAVFQEGVIHGVPVTAELISDLLDAASVLADLTSQPAPRAVGEEQARKANAGVHLALRVPGTERVGTPEPALVPPDPGRASVYG